MLIKTMGQIEIKHLKMIRAITETSNMTKAAQKLFISQSALSQQLKDIERKLNADLFFRTRKKMTLTPIGKKLLKTAQEVVAKIEAAELEIAKIVSGDCGELKVGTQCLFCYKWLPAVMRDFQRKFPKVEFEIGNSTDLGRELRIKKYDFIITAASEVDDLHHFVPLFDDQMVCIMPSDHPLSTRKWIDFADLDKVNLISHAEKNRSKLYQRFLKPERIEPKRFMVVGQPQAIIDMVASGFGISLFPFWAVKDQLESARLETRPLTQHGLVVTWYAVFLQNHQRPVFQNEFINIVSKMNLETV